MLNRRSFLALAATAASASARSKRRSFSKPLGAELYTVREQLKRDPATVIHAIAQIGYREAEPQRADYDRISAFLTQNGLSVPSIHFEGQLILGGEAPTVPAGYLWENVIELASGNGIHYVVFPFIPQEARPNLDAYRGIADKMNRAGEDAAKAGLQLCYHNHCFEFAGEPGKRPWDVLLERWDKKLVQLELDVFWLSVGGNDPSEVIQQQAGRVPLIHLKDKAFGTPVQYNVNLPHNDFMAVGTGVLDWPRILTAAEQADVKHYYVEQDFTPGPPVDSLRMSYDNLRKLKV
jgi:sugar phosphate isomerase/epimerase